MDGVGSATLKGMQNTVTPRSVRLRVAGIVLACASAAGLLWTGLAAGIPAWLVWATSSLILVLAGFEAGVLAERFRANRPAQSEAPGH